MKKTGWGNTIKRALALSVSVMLAVSVSVPTAAAGQISGRTYSKASRPGARESGFSGSPGTDMGHGRISYPQRSYEHYDPGAMEKAMEDFADACSGEGREEDVSRLYDEIISEFDRLATLTYMAQITYDRDVSDEEAAGEQAYTSQMYDEMADKAASCLKNGLSSTYRPLLEEKMGSENAEAITYYEEYSGEELELRNREQELLREYDQLASGGFTVQLEDGDWTYERLETDTNLDTERYAEIDEALDMEKNRVLGNNFLELVKVRREIAELAGYDNYAQYAYHAIYGRDYTMEDAEDLCAYVKQEIVPLNESIWNVDVDSASYDALYGLEDSTTDQIVDTVGANIESVDPDLAQIFHYMKDLGLNDIQSPESGGERLESSYTVGFPSYHDAFVFITRNNTFQDYQALIHEFGHFGSYYYNTVPEFFLGFNVDICELQSQGLEILMSGYAKDMFGEGGEAYAFETLTDMLYTAIMACILQDFEKSVYSDPDMSLEDMNRRFKEVQDAYTSQYYSVQGDMCYDWVDIPHLFYSPLYYIGYGTSALSALDLWTMAQEDKESAVKTYKGILKEGLDAPYRETISRWGMRDVFDREQIADLAGDIRILKGLGTGGYEEDLPDDGWEENTYAPAKGETQFVIMLGIVTVILLQAAILAVGITIMWMLTREKKK